ncbi:hypothetical protein E1B28_002245 [Marasmius oreades]|uniref:SGNH hydrolase-type esterase domain-containing protein n=1 Tax=Marasmius oreades TaxID=181124 RepID=A0A9P7UMX0_9AGAR|nr:uncharacterized protein E1B28_002245 [Marasmius oreades]KAG7086281.1 hypothetical protein E1B28_002245 [Marasmius oreades]
MFSLKASTILLFSSLFLSVAENVAGVSIPTSFVLIGDSTTAIKSGWGNGFCGSSTPAIQSSLEPATPCFNLAVGGANSGSYVTQGYWKTALNVIKNEVAKSRRTIVTIQFGHNDRNVGPASLLAGHLTAMVKEVKEVKAEPVLVTSLIVRQFDKAGTTIISDTLEPYAQATIGVAQAEKTHLLDLHAASKKYCEAIKSTSAHKFDPAATDYTHLNNKGMIVFGRMLADLMTQDFGLIGINLLPIIPNPALSYNISHGIPSY